VRPQARYEQSLALLKQADIFRRERRASMKTKSGLMVGLGETIHEILSTLEDLRRVGCDIATIGQYLQPHARRLPIEKYYTPAEFEQLRLAGEEMGFARVESGPLVRSSYHARRALEDGTRDRERETQ
jgi:lipoic acid synthetase